LAQATDDEWSLGLLAGAFVSEGFVSDRRAGFNNTDEDFFDRVVEAYDAVVGGPRYAYSRPLPSGKTLHELDVQNLGHLLASPLAELAGKRSAEKRIPSFVWEGSSGLKRAFLQALFEGDGSMGLSARHSLAIYYSTRSAGLAHDVQQLLLEFGVASRVHTAARGEVRVAINNRRNCRLFAKNVGFLVHKQARLRARLLSVPPVSRALARDHIPYVADYIRAECGRGPQGWLEKHNLDRIERWERDGDQIWSMIASDEVRRVIRPLVESGYLYTRVATVEPAGVQDVYSIRVDSDDHSFIANGFVNHNTECRLGQLAMQLMAGINEDTVDFVDNYSGEFEEPTALPARFPNLLVNGSQGIAVGMATNIPPHNLAEVIDATLHKIDHPDATPDDLMQFVKGPDFPTGAYILGRQGIMDAYRTGRGSIRMRAKADIVEGKRAQEIVVTELPYQVSVNTVATKIAELVDSRQIEGIRDVRNLSAREVTRLVIYLKPDANANVVLNNLYKHTPLQTSFGVNAVALVDGVPRTLNLAQMIGHYVDHQVVVVTRRSEHRLRDARDEAHKTEGLLRALDMIDEIIAMIRAADDKNDARTKLQAEPFSFSDVQAEHILDMTLARLTRLARHELEERMAKLRETIAELEAILADPAKLRGVIKDELGETREKFASPRRAEITFDPGDIDNLDLIEDEELVVTMSKAGYIKTVSADAFRTQGRGGRGISGAKLRDNDYVTRILHTTAHAYLLFFSNRGRVYRLRAHEIPMKERTARGTAIVNLLPLAPDERIQAVIDTRDYETSRYLFFATRRGMVKKTRFTEYDSSLRTGIIAINLKEGDELVRVIQTGGEDDIFMVSSTGMTIRFTEEDVRATGRAAQGVIGMRLRDDDEVVSCDVAREDADILLVTDAGFGKRTKVERFPRKGRGTLGVKGIKLTARRGKVVAAFMVGLDDEILLITSAGVTIRQAVRGISSQGRDATGVRIVSLDDGQTVAGVAPVLSVEE
ncbi:MAG: DNA gyrase subunit A, partial [Acidimicrobiales bacterium]